MYIPGTEAYVADRWSAGALPNGVVQLFNQRPNAGGEGTYLYSRGAGQPPVMAASRWNPGTGGYVDARTGQPLHSIGTDRASVLAKAMAAMQGKAGGGPAYYGDSYGGVQGAAQAARNRQQNYDLAQQAAAADAAENAARRDAAIESDWLNRDWSANQAALNRASALEIAKLPRRYAAGGYTGRGDPDEVAGTVHKGEYVIPSYLVDQATGLPFDPRTGAEMEHKRIEGQTPHYVRGVGYVRDFAVRTPSEGWRAYNPRQTPEAVLPPEILDGRRLTTPRRLTRAEENVVNEPANVAAFKEELTPALSRHTALQQAYENHALLAKTIQKRMDDDAGAGLYVVDPKTRRYSAPTGSSAAARLAQLEKDQDQVAETMAEIEDKLGQAGADVADVTKAHAGYGVRYKAPLVTLPGEQPGPGFIYAGQRRVAPVVMPRPQLMVEDPTAFVPQGPPAPDPVVAGFMAEQKARAARAAAQQVARFIPRTGY